MRRHSPSFIRPVRRGLVLAPLIAIAMTLALTSPASASFGFLTKWGSPGVSSGQFQSPDGLAVDATGNVYVTDLGRDDVQKFDSSGNFITQWGGSGTGNGQFDWPSSVATDSLGNVYVADSLNHRIQKFDSDGNFITKWGSQGTGNGQFLGLEGIAVDSQDNVYAAVSSHIQKFDSSGNFIARIGSQGSGAGQFQLAIDVTADPAGNIYVADYSAHRVSKFDSNGNYILRWGTYGVGNGQFQIPWGIASDSAGNVYVTEYVGHRVQKFDSTGNFVAKWGAQGTLDGQFAYPRGIAADAAGNIHVADISPRVQVFGALDESTISGESLKLTSTPNPATGVFTVSSKDPAIGLGNGNGSSNDPTISDVTVRVVGAGFDASYALPHNAWSYVGGAGNNKGYKYKDSSLAFGPIKTASFKSRRITLNGKGAQLGHTLSANPAPVAVEVTVGSLRHCMSFGGTTRFIPARYFQAKKAPAPAGCLP